MSTAPRSTLRFPFFHRSMTILSIVALAILATSLPALAEGDGAGDAKPHGGACKADSARLCPDLEGGQRVQCLGTHREELSEACAEVMKSRSDRSRRTAKRIASSCADDIEKHCGMAIGTSVIGCLMNHSEALAPACRQTLPQRQSQ